MKLSHRFVYFLLLLLSCFLILFGYYLQYYDNIQACLLCELQRYCMYGLIFLFCLLILVARWRPAQITINTLALLLSLLGLATAARQVWLQHQPVAAGQTLSCLPNASFLFKNFPLIEALKISYAGTADCAVVNWTLLGGSIADWSFFFFIVISAGVLIQYRKINKVRTGGKNR